MFILQHTRSPLASKPSTSSHHTSPAKVTQSKPISVPPSSKPAGYPILPNMPFATAASERTVPKAFSWHETAAPNVGVNAVSLLLHDTLVFTGNMDKSIAKMLMQGLEN